MEPAISTHNALDWILTKARETKAGHWKALNFSIVVRTWEALLLGPLQIFPNFHCDNLPSLFPAFAIYTGFFHIFQSFCGCGIGC
jgi:hypothetical protein